MAYKALAVKVLAVRDKKHFCWYLPENGVDHMAFLPE